MGSVWVFTLPENNLTWSLDPAPFQKLELSPFCLQCGRCPVIWIFHDCEQEMSQQLWFESLSHADQESDTDPIISAFFSIVQQLETLNSLNLHLFLYIFTVLPQRSCDLSAQSGHTLNLSLYRLLQVTFLTILCQILSRQMEIVTTTQQMLLILH